MLEWIHGARLQESRNTAVYNRKGDIVYPVAAVGCVLRKEKDSRGAQRFHLEHTDDIMSVAVHPDGELVATGQLGKRPKILVWDSGTLQTVRELTGHSRGVSHLAFSGDSGAVLASVGMDDDHSIVLHDWNNSTILGRTRGHPRQPYALCFTPDNRGLVLAGQKYILFIAMSGRNFAKKPAVFEGKGVMQDFLSIGWAARDAIIGCETGELYRFKDEKLVHIYDAHTGPVNSISSNVHGLVSGSKDGTIKLWSSTMELQREFNITKLASSLKPQVRSLFWLQKAQKVWREFLVTVKSRGA